MSDKKFVCIYADNPYEDESIIKIVNESQLNKILTKTIIGDTTDDILRAVYCISDVIFDKYWIRVKLSFESVTELVNVLTSNDDSI